MRHVPAAQPSLWMNLRGVERGEKCIASSVTFHWRPSYLLPETSGFASPPRDGFALFQLVLGCSIYCTIGTTAAALKGRRTHVRLGLSAGAQFRP